jgi:hypothetical protein
MAKGRMPNPVRKVLWLDDSLTASVLVLNRRLGGGVDMTQELQNRLNNAASQTESHNGTSRPAAAARRARRAD